jgi:hypothetical protein
MNAEEVVLRICPVHQEPLETKLVPILSGMHRYTPAWQRAQQERFPFSNTVVCGGCYPNLKQDTEALVCRACREEEIRTWHQDPGNQLNIPQLHIDELKRRYSSTTNSC